MILFNVYVGGAVYLIIMGDRGGGEEGEET